MGSVVNKSAGDAIIEKPREPAHIIVGIARMMLPVHANRSITRAYKTLYPLLRSHPYPLVYPDSYSGLQLGRDPASPPSPSQEHLNIPPGRLRSCRYPFPPPPFGISLDQFCMQDHQFVFWQGSFLGLGLQNDNLLDSFGPDHDAQDGMRTERFVERAAPWVRDGPTISKVSFSDTEITIQRIQIDREY